jgi:hypothetical protein
VKKVNKYEKDLKAQMRQNYLVFLLGTKWIGTCASNIECEFWMR